MKNNLRLFVFFLSLCLFLPRSNAEQDLFFPDPEKTISMDFQDASLKDILKIFSIQSGMNFIASEAVEDRKITLYLDNVSINETMDKLFKANNLTYEMEEEANIFIVKDWGKPELQTITKVYYLKYRSVPSARLEKEKNDLLSKDQQTSGREMSSGTEQTSGKADIITSLKQVISKEGKISEDITTNSLIVTDIPSRFPDIDRVIASLDIPQLQVMLDVEMLDVSRNAVDKLGFDYNSTTSSPLTLIFPSGGTSGRSFIGDFAKRALEFPNSSLAGTVTLGRTFAETLNFLRTQTDTRYLARPKLLTLNNETAEISITKDEIVGTETTSTVSATTGTTSDVKYIRSTDLKLTPEGTGIYLRVTPQVNPDTNEITLVINPKVSTTSTSAVANTQSDAEVRSTKSIVKVRNGETVILGGLIHQDKIVISKKLPILSDIPFLGMLFRHKNKTRDIERELLVFITPNIIKDAKFIPGKKAILPAREQTTKPLGVDRQASINTYLNRFGRE